MNLPTGTSYMGGGLRTLASSERELVERDVRRLRDVVEQMEGLADMGEEFAHRMETDPHDLNLTVRTIRAAAQELSESADRLSDTSEVRM